MFLVISELINQVSMFWFLILVLSNVPLNFADTHLS